MKDETGDDDYNEGAGVGDDDRVLKELPSQPNLRTKAVRPIDLCFFARRHNLLCGTSVKAEQTKCTPCSGVELKLCLQ